MAKFGAYDRRVQIYPPETVLTQESCPCTSELAPAALFEFPSNNVLQYAIDQPGVSYARASICATLGDGVTVAYGGGFTSNGGSDPQGFYNPVDDKIYFLSPKYAGANVISHAVWTDMFVQWDPRTKAITNEMQLPSGWVVGGAPSGGNTVIADLTDRWVWLTRQDTGDIKAFSLESFTEEFTAAAADPFVTGYLTGFAFMSGRSGQVIVQDSGVGDLHLLTCTDATNFTDVTLLPAAQIPVLDDDAPTRRCWLPALNILCLDYGPTPAGPIAALINLTTLAVRYVTSAAYTFDDCWWDTLLGRACGTNTVAPYGTLEMSASGAIVGTHGGAGSTGYNQPGFPLGGTVILASLSFDGYGEFRLGVPGNDPTPIATYPTTTWDAGGGETWGGLLADPLNLTTYVLRGAVRVGVPIPDGAGVPISGGGQIIMSSFVDPSLGPPPFFIRAP